MIVGAFDSGLLASGLAPAKCVGGTVMLGEFTGVGLADGEERRLNWVCGWILPSSRRTSGRKEIDGLFALVSSWNVGDSDHVDCSVRGRSGWPDPFLQTGCLPRF